MKNITKYLLESNNTEMENKIWKLMNHINLKSLLDEYKDSKIIDKKIIERVESFTTDKELEEIIPHLYDLKDNVEKAYWKYHDDFTKDWPGADDTMSDIEEAIIGFGKTYYYNAIKGKPELENAGKDFKNYEMFFHIIKSAFNN